MGLYGGFGGLQHPPHYKVHHPGSRTHKVDHLSVAHVGHIRVVHLGITVGESPIEPGLYRCYLDEGRDNERIGIDCINGLDQGWSNALGMRSSFPFSKAGEIFHRKQTE